MYFGSSSMYCVRLGHGLPCNSSVSCFCSSKQYSTLASITVPALESINKHFKFAQSLFCFINFSLCLIYRTLIPLNASQEFQPFRIVNISVIKVSLVLETPSRSVSYRILNIILQIMLGYSVTTMYVFTECFLCFYSQLKFLLHFVHI